LPFTGAERRCLCQTLSMADRVHIRSPEAFSERRGSLIAPAVVATCLGLALLVLGVGQWLLAEFLFHSGQLGLSTGDVTIPSSATHKAAIIAQHLWPAVVGGGLLALTWRLRGQARTGATLVAALASVIVCAAALPW
jgi:hypothetical protein